MFDAGRVGWNLSSSKRGRADTQVAVLAHMMWLMCDGSEVCAGGAGSSDGT